MTKNGGKGGMHLYTRLTIWGLIGLASVILAFFINQGLGGFVYFGVPILAGIVIWINYFICSVMSALIAPRIGKAQLNWRRILVAALIRSICYLCAFYGILAAWFTGGHSLENPADLNNAWGSTNNFVLCMYILALIVENALIVMLTFAMVH